MQSFLVPINIRATEPEILAAEPPLIDTVISTWSEESFTMWLVPESAMGLGCSHQKPVEIILSKRGNSLEGSQGLTE